MNQMPKDYRTAYEQQMKQAKMLMAGLEQSLLTMLADEQFQQMTAEKFEAYDEDGSGNLDAQELTQMALDNDPPPMMMNPQTGEMAEMDEDMSLMITNSYLQLMDID